MNLPKTTNNVYKSDMVELFYQEFQKSPYIWSILVLILISLTYAALKIKNEPDDYLKKSTIFSFQNFNLRIPGWWTLTINENNLIRFERTDTRYDWYAEFSSLETNQPSREILEKMIKKISIEFDEVLEPEEIEIINGDSKIKIYRREGMSTISGIERAYFDLFVARNKFGKTLIGKSHSSILNGCVEGPYFEEVINRLTSTN